MKILSVLDTLEIGGTEVSLREIYRRFQATDVVVCHLYPGHRLAATYRAAGLQVISLDLAGKYSFRKAIRQLGEIVQREQPDLLLASLFRASIVCRVVARRCGRPLVDSFVNESYSPYRWQTLNATGKMKLLAVLALDRSTARWATWFTAVSEAVRDSNCRALRVPRERVSVIHRGRDPEVFHPLTAAERKEARNRLGIETSQLLLLNVARLLPRKGHRELLQAMQDIKQRRPDAVLLLAGDGDDRPRLEATIQTTGLAGHVHLLGRRTDIPELLGAADLFVFPSHYEGHAGSLLEAMMVGRPIVATDTATHRETVTDGETARLVPVQAPQALARAVCELLDDPERAQRLGAQARREALARFHVDHVAAQHEELYRQVAEGATQELLESPDRGDTAP